MALKGLTGPDRCLYALASILQAKLPAVINEYNSEHKATALLVLNTLTFDSIYEFKFNIGNITKTINIPAGTFNIDGIKQIINSANTGLFATKFNRFSLLLEANESLKFITPLGNIKANQIINYQPLMMPNSFILNGELPSEEQIKNFPAIILTMNTITPANDGILVDYDVDLTVGATSPINSSQIDYLSGLLMKYYDCLATVINSDDGSLGGIINGVSINSASIDEAAGNSYFLKYLTISLSLSVEED